MSARSRRGAVGAGLRASACLLALLAGCGASAADRREARIAQHGERSRALGGASDAVARAGEDRCAADERIHEVSEYDTSGDEFPDVRKVFLRVGDPPAIRLVLICREVDLNADGTKDQVRFYTDEGRPLREEADRNFDGQMDEIIFFEDGRIVRMEQDSSGNGMVDTKVFYEDGRPIRSERDMAGRSTIERWRPDRWEYFESGRMVRMGSDVDGDGTVDRWDRDAIFMEQLEERQRAEEERAALEQGEDADQTDDDVNDDDVTDD